MTDPTTPRPSPDPLADLADRALGGDLRATDALCRELQGPLYRLAVRLLQNSEDARDATQEALLQVVMHLSTFRRESALMTWAYSISLRHFLRTRRKRERINSRLMLELKIRAGLLLTSPDAPTDAERAIERRETCFGCTRAMLQCLTLEERATIVLAEILGADDTLGAKLCGVNDATYRKRLSRARTKLRPIVEELCGLTDERNPCSCERQTRAKHLVGIKQPIRLPVVEMPDVSDAAVVTAAERLGEVRRWGAALAGPVPIVAPEDLWARVTEKLGGVLGHSR